MVLFDDFYTGENEQLKINADLMKEKLKYHEQVSSCIFIFNQIAIEHSSQIRKKKWLFSMIKTA